MNNGMEIGDLFVITRKGRYRNKPCPYADKEYVIKSFSKSGGSVYYDDNRTNIKCRCNNCHKTYHREFINGEWVNVSMPRCIGVVDIRIVEKRLERERDIKIKLLGI